MKNCANYGPIIHSANEEDFSCIGGIVGYSDGFTLTKAYIQNSLSCGSITYSGGKGSVLLVGGITGYSSDRNEIENSVSNSEITSSVKYTYIGGIAGFVFSTNLTNCFWTNSAEYDACGYGNLTGDERAFYSQMNSELVGKLNEYSAGKGSWNKWFLNGNGALVTFKINEGNGFAVGSPIVLLVGLVDNNERNFSGWYNDMTLVSPFTDSKVEGNATLHGMFCGGKYTVTFDIGNGTTVTTLLTCNESIPYPATLRDEYTFAGWFTDSGFTVPFEEKRISKDTTLYAKYNNNTVSFSTRTASPLLGFVFSLLFILLGY